MNQIDYYAQLLTSGKISRREFTGRAVALGATTALATSLAGKALQAAMPKSGGRLRIGQGHGSTTDTLDPAHFENGNSIFCGYAYRGHLTEVSNTGDLIPDLAESWEASDDAVTWTFHIRKGVEFHNGRPSTRTTWWRRSITTVATTRRRRPSRSSIRSSSSRPTARIP